MPEWLLRIARMLGLTSARQDSFDSSADDATIAEAKRRMAVLDTRAELITRRAVQDHRHGHR